MSNKYNLDNLTGKLLIASPNYFFSDIFKKSVIYITSNNKEGTVGLIVNRPINHISYDTMIKMIKSDSETKACNGSMAVYLGGPTEPERGFILHSAEYDKNVLIKCSNNIAVSSNTQILQDIASGNGPENSLFVLGYTNWEEGQLEMEMNENMWVVSEFNQDILFVEKDETKWSSMLKQIGVDSSLYTSRPGYC